MSAFSFRYLNTSYTERRFVMVDLHTHTTASDGTYTPSELVAYAIQKGLSALAITDHDTIAGLNEAFAAASGSNLELISGIEFSTEYKGKDIHIVGLNIDYKNPIFLEKLARFIDSRDIRNEKMCQLLTEQGLAVTPKQLQDRFPDSVITRAHFARFLLEKGYISQLETAFTKYIGDNAPCYVAREKVNPVQAIRLIIEAGGIPVLAHPILYKLPVSELEELVAHLVAHGLIGIEAIYSTYNRNDEACIRQLAKKYRLTISGGSDFHGKNKPYIDLGIGRGNLNVPDEVWKNLKATMKY